MKTILTLFCPLLLLTAYALGEESRVGSHRPITVTRPVGTGPTRADGDDVGATDKELADLLTKIDQTELPVGYDSANHQPWVDRRMEALNPKQRGRIGRLWKAKRRLQPKMKNAGMSFVPVSYTHLTLPTKRIV